ncbi:RDD family protein [Stackebrandtia endophytica]|nr:RDD family protein [Stackebrandtia endophytica]
MTDNSAETDTSGRLVSGEAVELDVRIARLGSRVLAFTVDFVVLALGAVVLTVVAGIGVTMLPDAVRDRALLEAVRTVTLLFALVAIPVTIETLSKGRSLGKLMLGLRVVRDDGGPIRFRHCLVRGLSAFGVEFPGLLMPGVTWLAAIGVMLIHPSGKRIGDLMAGTIVIHERTPVAKYWVPAMPVGLAQWSRVADLTNLDDNLALAVRHFLSRNKEISEPARSRLGAALDAELRAVVTPPPAGTPGWAFLAAVLAERYRRSGARMARNRAVTAQVWDTLYGPVRSAAAGYPPMPVPPSGTPGRAVLPGGRPGPSR